MSALTDQRPWGHYTVLADEEDHKVKRIVVQPGKRLSLQRHQHRAEHWYVVKGEARVTLDESDNMLTAGKPWTFRSVQSIGSKTPALRSWSLLKSKPAATLEKMTLNALMTTSAGPADSSPLFSDQKPQLMDVHFVD